MGSGLCDGEVEQDNDDIGGALRDTTVVMEGEEEVEGVVMEDGVGVGVEVVVVVIVVVVVDNVEGEEEG